MARPQCDTPLVKIFGDFHDSLTPPKHKGNSKKKKKKKKPKTLLTLLKDHLIDTVHVHG